MSVGIVECQGCEALAYPLQHPHCLSLVNQGSFIGHHPSSPELGSVLLQSSGAKGSMRGDQLAQLDKNTIHALSGRPVGSLGPRSLVVSSR